MLTNTIRTYSLPGKCYLLLALASGTATVIVPTPYVLVALICSAVLLAAYYFHTELLATISGLTIAIGSCQVLLASTANEGRLLFLDDFLLACAVVASVTHRPQRLSIVLPLVTASLILLGIALVRASMFDVSILQFRQLTVVLALTFVGYQLRTSRDRAFVLGIVVASASAVSLYAIVEWLGGPPVNPALSLGLLEFRGGRVVDGVPASYYVYGFLGEDRIQRVGSILMNPPEASILLGTAFAATLTSLKHTPRRVVLLLLLALGLLLTVGRAGWLVAAIGFVYALSVRRGSIQLFLALAVPTLVLGGWLSLTGGNSIRHLEGLGTGLLAALLNPLGHGFGGVGNFAVTDPQGGTGESAFGLATYSLGALPLIVWLLAVTKFIRAIPYKVHFPDVRAVGLAALFAFTLSESVVSLAGAAGLWILLGVSLSQLSSVGNHTKASAMNRQYDAAKPYHRN